MRDLVQQWLRFLTLWLRAWRGDPFWQTQLAAVYATSEGCLPRRSDVRARRWYRRAAAQGYADAQYNLAWMLLLGEGGPQSRAEAEAYLRLAAQQGEEQSARLLEDLRAGALLHMDRGEGPEVRG